MVRKCILGVFLFVTVALFAIGLGSEQESPVYLPGNSGDIVRLHVVANSDAPFDQMVKLKVRDALLSYMGPKLRRVTSAGGAAIVISENRRDMEEIARRVLLLNGLAYPVQVQFGQFDFPIKAYGDAVYPAGQYKAVRVMLGKAEGSNWWCVLFPPLCFIDTNNAVSAKAVELDRIADSSTVHKVELRWKLLEIWRQADKE